MVENPETLWMVILGGIIMLTVAFVIGANDVANSFGTSVGSKSLTLPMACILASIFETLGAVALGATVASTFENSIIDPKYFDNHQPLLMFGMIASLIGSMVWLFIATHLGMPVSTTHSIVGAILGFAIASNHIESIHWRNLGLIAVSWIISPLISSGIACFIFWSLRLIIFRHTNCVRRGFNLMWILITFISIVISTFIVFGNPVAFEFSCPQLNKDGFIEVNSPCVLEAWAISNFGYSIPLTLGLAAIIAVISNSIIYKHAKNSISKYDLKHNSEKKTSSILLTTQSLNDEAAESKPLFQPGKSTKSISPLSSNSHDNLEEINHQVLEVSNLESNLANEKESTRFTLIKTFSVEDEIKNSKLATHFNENGEKFDPKIEVFAGAVQVFSACFASLAHGANDVSNAVGPFATIFSIYKFGLTETTTTPHWILFLCGLFISLGLALYGYKVIRTIGISMIQMTPCRGVCIETATAFTVVVFSKLGFPLSTTYCQVGSLVGVGLIEPTTNHSTTNWLLGRNVNYKLFIEIFAAWIFTIICSGLVTAIVFLFGSWLIPF